MNDQPEPLAPAEDGMQSHPSGAVLQVERRDFTDLVPERRPRVQSLRGFDDCYTDIVDYIVRCTHRIWDERDVGLIYTHYTHNCVAYSSLGTVYNREDVVRETIQRIVELPDRRGMATQVIWRGDDVSGFYTSHLVTGTGRHTEHGMYGKPTGRSFAARTIADCMIFENKIFREWLVRDNMALVVQLGLDPHAFAADMARAQFDKGQSVVEIGENRRLIGQHPPEVEADVSIAHTDGEATLLRWLHHIYNRRMFGKIAEVYAPNVQWHGPMMRELFGVAAVMQQTMRLVAMIPDGAFIPQHVLLQRVRGGRREARGALDHGRPPSRPRQPRRADRPAAVRDGHEPLPRRRGTDRRRVGGLRRPRHARSGQARGPRGGGVMVGPAEAALDACLARIAAHDASLSAIASLDPGARGAARRLDAAQGPHGDLHGLAVALKDNIDVAGRPTASGCRALAGAMPMRDAAIVRRLRAAGAVIVAKTHLSELSFELRSRSSLGGDVRNPFDPSVTAGGSSGGAAAAVAAGFAWAAVGTDTGGSVRVPAAFCGLVGLRPTHGLIDLAGVAPLAPSTDTAGPIARSVEPAARLFAVLADAPPAPARSLRGAAVGALRQAFGDDAEIGRAMQDALALMADAGARIVDPAPLPADALPAPGPHVVDWEFRAAFDGYLASNFVPGTAPASVAEIIAGGAFLPEHRAALQLRAAVTTLDSPVYRCILAGHLRLRDAVRSLMDRCDLDALAYPTSAVIPSSLDNPAVGWAPELAARTGLPAITLPVGRSARGVPIGLELLGRAGCEGLLLGLAADIERRRGRRYAPALG